MEITRTFGYFCNTEHFKITNYDVTLYQDLSDFRDFIHFLEH